MSRRIYITLNDKKEKDKVILDYLSSSYSESDTIKDVLYRIATNSYNLNLKPLDEIGVDRCEKVEIVSKDNESEKVQEIPISSDIMSMF